MSKRSGRKKSEDTVRTADASEGAGVSTQIRAAENGAEARAVAFGGAESSAPASVDDARAREAAVEELDEALEALPDEAAPDGSNAESDIDPLSRIDVSGETSFDSAVFDAEDEEAAEDEEEDGVEDEEDADEETDEDVDEAEEDESEDEESDVVIHDADAEDRAEEFERRAGALTSREAQSADDEVAPGGQPRELAELVSVCEALIFVSEEPLPVKAMADLLGEDRGWMQVAVEELAKEFNERNGGLMLREVAGGWQFATRPEHHEQIRAYLKSKPSAKLSLAALETLAVIAYKQPVTVPEILEIRGVQSSSAIKTLLDKRLIIAKGRKETVGRPMMYGTSKEFLLQFGLKDLSELPNVEDFQDLAGAEA
jgi:segregation and condensation protein B